MKTCRKNRKFITVILVLSLVLTGNVFSPISPKTAKAASLSSPRISRGIVTWDCVYFGNYWQRDTNGDGTADQYDDREPIKWRVLSVSGDDVFLLADQNLEAFPYHYTEDGEKEDVTWEDSFLRAWLEVIFMNDAFTYTEQSAILRTTVANKDNTNYGTEGGNNTSDRLYLLSIEETMNTAYGFTNNYGATETREGTNTQYVADGGVLGVRNMSVAGAADIWWLRSPGAYETYASFVLSNGYVDDEGDEAYYINIAVRPVLHLKLSATSVWSYAGTVSSDGTVTVPTPEPQTPAPQTPVPQTPTQSVPNPAPVDPNVNANKTGKPSSGNLVKAGSTVTVSGLQYKVLKSTGSQKTVAVYKAKNKNVKRVNIPSTIKIKSSSYKVVQISPNAFKGCKQLQTVNIGKEMQIIGNGAFSGCKKITKIVIQSQKLKKIGKGAFSGLSSKAKIRVPNSKVARYRKLMKKG